MCSGVEFCWGAFSIPLHGLALWVGDGGDLRGTSPLHLALGIGLLAFVSKHFSCGLWGFWEKQSIHHTSFLNEF